MRYRVLQGFVLAPGRLARPGDEIELNEKTVNHNGLTLTLGHVIHRSLIEPIVDVPEPAVPSTESRDAEPTHRDPIVTNRDPQPKRRRGQKGAA